MWVCRIFFIISLLEHSVAFCILWTYSSFSHCILQRLRLIWFDIVTDMWFIFAFQDDLKCAPIQGLALILLWRRYQSRYKWCRLFLFVGTSPVGVWASGAPVLLRVCGTCSKLLWSTINGGTFTNGSTNHSCVGKPHVIIWQHISLRMNLAD